MIFTTPATEAFDKYLQLRGDHGTGFKSRVSELLLTKSVVPGFSATTLQLMEAAQDPNTSIKEFARIIGFDPALALRCIKAATSVGAGGRNISTVEQAIMYIGVKEMQQVAISAGVMDRFSHLKTRVDWEEYWMHSILVARLTHKISASFRDTRGTEYLAGLLHDTGKLLLWNYFSTEYDDVLTEAAARRRPHHEVEVEMLGLDHAQIGAAMCHAMGVHTRVINGVLHHHHPTSPASVKAPMSENGFLAACIAVANGVAKMCAHGFHCNEDLPPLEEMAEWHHLASFENHAPVDLDVATEYELAQTDLKALTT